MEESCRLAHSLRIVCPLQLVIGDCGAKQMLLLKLVSEFQYDSIYIL